MAVPQTHGGNDGTADGAREGSGGEHAGLGICCSGGGIRSAAFNLGALQSLDQDGVLARADYLSAVSGGAYIASAFAIASRYSHASALSYREGGPAARPLAPGTPEEAWVRNRCSYLAEGVGDTARIVAMAVVGFLANVLFLTTLLWAVARPAGWLYGRFMPGLRAPGEAELGNVRAWAVVAGAVAGAGLAVALVVRVFRVGWWVRENGRRWAVLLFALGVLVAVIGIVLPWLVLVTRNLIEDQVLETTQESGAAPDTGATGLGWTAALGGVATTAALVWGIVRPVADQATTAVSAVRRGVAKLGRGLRRLVYTVIGGLIGPLALLAGAVAILAGGVTASPPGSGEVIAWAGMTAAAVLLAVLGDPTAWSLHPFYKRRLSRTFAVRRVDDGTPEGSAEEVPFRRMLRLSDFAADRFPIVDGERLRFPEIVVCAAVNVSDAGVTPPGRSALSFVFSPSTIGCPGQRVVVPRRLPLWCHVLSPADAETGSDSYGPLAMEPARYESLVGDRRGLSVTLPAAVAISGAAVAPAMGKMTSAPLRFLLALTNVRLGVWLTSPAWLDARDTGTATRRTKRSATPVRMLYEMLGYHRVRSRFLYVTDGGHVENLGLVELLRRRCDTIISLDAAGGPTDRLSTLGEAIAIAKSELNVDIEIAPDELIKVTDRTNACNHVVGTIRYPDRDTPGRLIFGKAVVTADAPWDVRAYLAKDEEFPTHGTIDQLYSGETFDAYQALGRCVGAACARELQPAAPAPPEPPRTQVLAAAVIVGSGDGLTVTTPRVITAPGGADRPPHAELP
ncbi:MAG TPA: hypothetical protein VFI47_09740 [Acidimicrobiales bacterium]|nr:hypothetical protein [Acidimicrobiales bacterium]